jgi:hypothetical protein
MTAGKRLAEHPGLIDAVLLCLALALGIASTLRSLGTGSITLKASLLLGTAILLAIRPLAGLIERHEGRGGGMGAVLAVILGAHLIATLFFFPPEDVLDSRPVITLDHALHYQQVVRATEVFGDSHRLYAYDPYFMAGYPGGTVFDIDSKGVELWCVMMRFADTARAFKIFIFAGYMLLPLTIYAGSRRLGFSFDESVLSVLLLLAFWHWGRPYVGQFRFAGMFSYLIVSHMSVYIIGLFRSFLRGQRAWPLWIAGPLVFFIHPTAAVLLPVPFLALFFSERKRVEAGETHRRWEVRALTGLLSWCLLVIAVNSIWLVPFFRYLDIKVASETFFQTEGPMRLLALLLRPGNAPALLIVALAVAGTFHLLRKGRAGDAAGPAAGSLFLLAVAAFGIYLPVFDQMEPGRFLVPAVIFMSPLAGAGMMMILQGAGRIVLSRSLGRPALAAVLISLLVSSPVLALLSSRGWYRHTLSTSMTPEVGEMIDALIALTEHSGRIMVEDGPAWNYGDSFIPAIIPQFTGVEQIGGPYPWAYIRHNFTNFHMCSAMGRPLPEMGSGELRRYMMLYNVRWILTSTQECREFFGKATGFDLLWSSRHFSIWDAGLDSGSLEARGITVLSSYDRIYVTLKPDEEGRVPERVLLPYHWDPGLHIEPPSVLLKEYEMEDPVPFIILEPNGESDILIKFR